MLPLTSEEQNELLRLARRTIVAALEGELFDRSTLTELPASDSLCQPAAAFVTLHARGCLRGCVGTMQGNKPLYQAVASAAVAAACHDHRFLPVRKDELKELEIEISILSPLVPLRPEDVVVGQHGLVVSQGQQRGLLLPQVAVEHSWGREEFLEQTCLKAGLPRDAWRQGAKIEGFVASVFSEATRPVEGQ